MVQGGDQPRLPFEPGEAVGVELVDVRKDLDGDLTVQTGIAREVDDARSTAPELALDRIRPQHRRRRHRSGAILLRSLYRPCRSRWR